MVFKDQTIFLIFFLFLFAVLAGLFLFDLEADAAADIDFITAHLSEEGFKIFSARNLVLFGDVVVDPAQSYTGWIVNAPLSQFIYAAVFKLDGCSYATGRFVSVLLAYGAVFLLFLFWRRTFKERKFAVIGLLLVLGSYPFIMYARFISIDTPAIFLLILSSVFFFSKRKIKGRVLASGFLFGLALLCKQVALVALPAFGAVLLLRIVHRENRSWMGAVVFVVGVALVLVFHGIWSHFWPVFETLPAAAWIGAPMAPYSQGIEEMILGIGRLWSNALEWSLSPVLTKMPAASLLAYLGIVVIVLRWIRRRGLREKDLFFTVWFFCVALAAVAVGFSQAPTRLMIYSVPAVWTLALTAVEAIGQKDEKGNGSLSFWQAVLFLLFCLICAYGIVSLGVYWTCAVFFKTIDAFGRTASIANQIGAVVLGLLLWGGLLRFGLPSSRWLKRSAVTLVVLGAIFGGMLYGRWALTGRTHQTVEVSRKLAVILPSGSKVQGSLQFMLENDHIWFSAVPRVANHRWISAADHFLFSHHDDQWADELDSSLRQESLTVIREFQGGGERTFTLYRVDPAYRITPSEYRAEEEDKNDDQD